MIYKINKKALLEEAFQDIKMPKNKELRFTMDVTNFESIHNHIKNDHRIDWYFPGYRIRYIHSKKPYEDNWFKIMEASAGLAKKKTIGIPKPSKEEQSKFDKTCTIKIMVQSKRPVVKGEELYLEKITATDPKKNKTISYYSTEAEDSMDLKRIDILNTMPQIKNIKNVGDTNTQTLAKQYLAK